MAEQTKRRVLPDEFWTGMRWIRASIERDLKEMEEMREFSRRSRKRLEAIVGPIPKH